MEPNANSPPDALDALRIQAAAVAAQQAALTEEELRLQQRRGALEKQEGQLAAHLDDRRRRLLELQDEIKTARAALETERAELLAGVRQEKETALNERQQVAELHKRLKLHWREHWGKQETAYQQREQQLDAERAELRKQTGALDHERTTFDLGRMRLNGELELRRCELQEEAQELALVQQDWDQTINYEHAERQRLETALAERAAATALAEQTLAEQQRQWEQGQDARRQEIDGLEKRIRHLRSQLPQEQIVVQTVPAAPRTSDGPEVPAALRRLADDVADHRWRLLEQWQQLLTVYDLFDKEHLAVAHDLDATALQFNDRELQLVVQERELEERVGAARRYEEALTEQRQRLDGWQSRLTAQESAWESERAALLADVQARAESVVVLTQQLEAVRQRREQRRRQEIETLRTAHARCEEMRRQYVALWQDCQTRQTALAQREREVATLRLALERYRVEFVSRSSNPAAADKRIEKLTQKAAARFAALERDLTKQRDALSAEAAQLDGRATQLNHLQDELDQRQQDLSQAEATEETRQHEQAADEQERERELRCLRLRRDYDERQLAVLRDEVERVARLLLDDAPDEQINRAA